MEKIPSSTISTETHTLSNNTYNTKLRKKKKNENQTMTPLSKCLYKGMIDFLKLR